MTFENVSELKEDIQLLKDIIENQGVEKDNSKFDLRSNLMNELPRGTLKGLRKLESEDFIIYYSRKKKFGIFYNRSNMDFLFVSGSLF